MNKIKLSIIINTYNRKQMLEALVQSILKCRFNFTYEIIVLDDHSVENYKDEIVKFPKIKWFRNNRRLFLVKSRNKAWKKSQGEYLFFIDDDNEILDKQFFIKSINILEKNKNIGILGCRTFYFSDRKRILVGFNKFYKYSGRVISPLLNKIDIKESGCLIDTFDTPNAFFTRHSIIKKIDGFDNEIIQTFSEADFAERVRKVGLKVMHSSQLKVYHKSPLVDFIRMNSRVMGGSPERLYYLIRNRYIIVKRYSNTKDKTLFLLFFSPLYVIYYIYQSLKIPQETKLRFVKSILKGASDGFFYMISGRLNNFFNP